MIVFLFAPGALSVFWEFSDQELDAKIRDSLAHPIFAVAHTDYCPHCIGVPEALRRYAADLGDSTNLVFTTINCMKSDACRRLGVQGVPSFRFIRGPNPRYWVQTQERGLPGWADFLNSVNGPPLVKVDSPSDRSNPLWGSTSFHMSVDDSNELLDAYRQAALDLRIYGGTFSYSFETIDRPVLTAFLSAGCNLTIWPKNSGDVSGFLSRNRFSVTHQYDGAEFENRDRTRPMALLVTEGFPSHQHFEVMDRYASKYCEDIRFGWAVASDQGIVSTFGRVAEDAPFFALLNDRERVNVTTKKKIRDADRNGFFDVVLNRKAPEGLNVVVVTLVAVAIYFVAVFWFVLLYTEMAVSEDKAE
jgi:hypothetical protein